MGVSQAAHTKGKFQAFVKAYGSGYMTTLTCTTELSMKAKVSCPTLGTGTNLHPNRLC